MATVATQSDPLPLTKNEFNKLANVSRETSERLEIYFSILKAWQQKINLVSTKTLDDVWRRHMLDSIQLISHIPPAANTIVDLGSGAGFPGLILAIATGQKIALIESNGRKCAFLREAARQTNADVDIQNRRIESIKLDDPADVITARACAPLSTLLNYSQNLRAKNGTCLFLKGKDVQQELTESAKKWNISHSLHESMSDSSGAIVKIGAFSKRHGN